VNLSQIVKRTLFLLVFLSLSAQAQTATIQWGTSYQTIDGFGAAMTEWNNPFSAAELDFFCSPTSGIGLSLLRVEVNGSGSYPNVASMQGCASRGASVWAMSLSPPASMKTNGSTICSTNGSTIGYLASSSYPAFATYLSNLITTFKNNGVNLYGISPQNEPDYCPGLNGTYAYDGAIWTGADFQSFIESNLGPTMAANGQSGVKIIFPESATWLAQSYESGTPGYSALSSPCMSDAGCANYVGVTAWHDYDDASVISNPYSLSHFWETEDSDPNNPYDSSMEDALTWANLIQSRMAQANATAWHWWVIQFVGATSNEGLEDPSGFSLSNLPKRTYAIGNFSKFIRPGWVRISATLSPQSGVTVSAYKDSSSGQFAIVAINQNGSSVAQEFVLNAFSPATVTPWITSANLSLAEEPSVAAGGSFTYTLPAESVTTFVGVAGTAGPDAPADLKATLTTH